jgi:hypothetical protein
MRKWDQLMETIYAIQNTQTRTAYVGRTHRSTSDRWIEHLNAAASSTSHKLLSEALRHDPTGFEIIELETSETCTEALWLDAYIQDGWTMLNEAGANKAQPKRRDKEKERVWREVNQAARTTGMNIMPNGQTVHEYIRDAIKRGSHLMRS